MLPMPCGHALGIGEQGSLRAIHDRPGPAQIDKDAKITQRAKRFRVRYLGQVDGKIGYGIHITDLGQT